MKKIEVILSAIAIGYCLAFGINKLVSNSQSEYGRFETYGYGVGALDMVEHTKYKSVFYPSDTIYHYRTFLPDLFYDDGSIYGEQDDKVDRIIIMEKEDMKILNREEDYESNKRKFNRADKVLSKYKKKSEKRHFNSKNHF